MNSSYSIENIKTISIYDLPCDPAQDWCDLLQDCFLDDVTWGDAYMTLISVEELYAEAKEWGMSALISKCEEIREKHGDDILIALDG